MKRFRALILGIEGAALVGVVTFTIVGDMHTRQPIFLALQFLCGLLIVAGELAVRRIDTRVNDPTPKSR